MKKFIAVSIGTLLFSTALFAAGQTQGQQARVRMATGGNTGTYYAFGSAVGQILTEKTGIQIPIQSTGASKANIQLIAGGEVELAIVQNDVMDYAYRGTDLFTGEGTQAFSAMAALYAEVCQIIASPGIRSISDLKGKRVSVGDAGSGVEFNAKQILEAYGVTFNDIDKQNLSFGASADAFRDGKIDAFFCTAGAPTTAVVDLAISKEITLLEIDDVHATALITQFPFYTKFPVPADSYRGVTRDIQTVAVKATFIVSNKLSEDIVYRLTKNLIESKAQIQAAHAKGAELSSDYAVGGISVPFHPGAAKYFREIGVIK
ncbi:C4-dicarboxylate ABC transporter substrate-binding protein [Spirochaetia bacterium]|nr:C4-dicarboxylate ABC transporter substrate-binding protein [Spirochaetia bacterium]GHU29805.1 C4-dicarboxylate ABC transporter substrate-binding protein [Spirochaetia bacterium]